MADFDFQGIVSWYIGILTQKYADFNGRARRKEFWYFVLCNLAISFALIILSCIPILGWLFRVVSSLMGLALFIPNLAIGIRRLHDTDRSGWWILLALIPLVGAIILIVWAAMEGTVGDNQYGPDPKADERGTGNTGTGTGSRVEIAPPPASSTEQASPADDPEKPVFCGECGAKNQRGTKFCGSCGAKLN